MTNALHILVVEDEEIIAALIERTLVKQHYRVTVVGDGEAAWQILQGSQHFDAILLDRGLPTLDGLSLLKRIKADAVLRTIPVVMETGQGDLDSVREGIDAGAYYYLTKPLYPQLLISVLHSAMEQRKDLLTMLRSGRESAEALSFLNEGTFYCRTLDEARKLACGLARICPDPVQAGLGLQELLINAVEHGNLGIRYAEKTALVVENRWQDEVERRLADPAFSRRRVTVQFSRTSEEIALRIQDEGDGFDWHQYLNLSPERAFAPHGRGIAMARMMSFDTLEYTGKGNIVTVTLSCSRDAANQSGSE